MGFSIYLGMGVVVATLCFLAFQINGPRRTFNEKGCIPESV